ncbi:MAG TPA: AmmeMemoRadiSam system protein A [Clostridia bacterium]|nr:AmmeMemoRadiSam system protein A [Clostridia bacterium]
MGNIINSYIFPHPPIIVPEVGKGEEKGAEKTLNAVKKAAEEIRNDRPTTIILTTPHGPVFQDYVYISDEENLAGNLSRFGAGNVKLSFVNNTDLVSSIITYAAEEGIYSGGLPEDVAKKYKITKELDHGALIPLYFIGKELQNFKLVHIAIAGLPFIDLYRFGRCIAKAVENSDENVVFVASGDMSHRLTNEAPYGYSEKGKIFDDILIESIKNVDIERLLSIDEHLCEEAGECGLRSFIMMFGALDGYDIKPEVYSYEGPFGVGYSIAKIAKSQQNDKRRILKIIGEKDSAKLKELRANEDVYVALARNSLETYVRENRIIRPDKDLPSEIMENSAGTFVSIKKHGQLRGCIGTISPTRENIAQEIIYNAISAGTRDPRFNPIEENELQSLVYSVDVLKEAEPIDSIKELDTVRYGVIVKKGRKSGLLLPNLEGVDTPEEQVSIALQKAGISPNEDYRMERFEVIRHK